MRESEIEEFCVRVCDRDKEGSESEREKACVLERERRDKETEEI